MYSEVHSNPLRESDPYEAYTIRWIKTGFPLAGDPCRLQYFMAGICGRTRRICQLLSPDMYDTFAQCDAVPAEVLVRANPPSCEDGGHCCDFQCELNHSREKDESSDINNIINSKEVCQDE